MECGITHEVESPYLCPKSRISTLLQLNFSFFKVEILLRGQKYGLYGRFYISQNPKIFYWIPPVESAFSEDPNLMRSHLKISLKSSKNLLTIHVEDMKLIVDAMFRNSHLEFFLGSSEDLLSNSFWDLHDISKRFFGDY